MTLITTLGICATFFTIFILLVHLSIIGVKWYKAKSKKQKDKDLERMRILMEQIKKEDANALNKI